jgi:hypothetical protein
MSELLLYLAEDMDDSLVPLGMRLDFNEFYARHDRRLGTPLTFRHQTQRLSMSASSVPRHLLPHMGSSSPAYRDARLSNNGSFAHSPVPVLPRLNFNVSHNASPTSGLFD